MEKGTMGKMALKVRMITLPISDFLAAEKSIQEFSIPLSPFSPFSQKPFIFDLQSLGKLKVKAVSPATVASNFKSPPWARAISRDKLNPNPNPSICRPRT